MAKEKEAAAASVLEKEAAVEFWEEEDEAATIDLGFRRERSDGGERRYPMDLFD